MAAVPDISVLPLERDLDVVSAPELRAELERVLAGGCKRVIVNMAKARYADSSGLGVLVSASRSFRACGGLLSVANASPQVEHAMRVARLVDFIPMQTEHEPGELPELSPTVDPLWRRTLFVDAEDIGGARRRLESLASGLGFTQDGLFDLSLACGEAIGNAVDHTCEDGILVTATAYPDRLVVQVSDCGQGFDEAECSCGCASVRGRGIKLMRMLADDVVIEPKNPGPGTVVRITKLF